MAKKQYFIIVDTETTIKDTVADFGAVVCDRNGVIVASCGVLVKGNYDAMDLFYVGDEGFFSRQSVATRKAKYGGMLETGTRLLASVNAINRWLEKTAAQYNPTLTAYNLAFDLGKCHNTGIDLTMFKDSFCLWAASVGNICNKKSFKQFALENHAFNNVTMHGNMTFQTNAEIVAGFIAGEFSREPHTALEDAQYFELPILKTIIAKRNWKENITAYNWKSFQVKDHYTAK